MSTYDNALFLWHDDNGMLIGILVSHADDFAFAGSQNFYTTVIEEFKKNFKIKQHKNSSFKYVASVKLKMEYWLTKWNTFIK